jgi:hypothetical protein
MPHYRCYCLSADPKILAVAEATHADDTGAIQWAELVLALGDHKDCQSIELWRDGRYVHSAKRREAAT